MVQEREYLGVYSDWIDAARRDHALFPVAPPGPATQQRVRETLGFVNGTDQATQVRVDRRWERDGLVGEAVSWSVGYGPRTQAWVLKPSTATEPLPAVLALHDHGGFKFYGKEKIADGPDTTPNVLHGYRDTYYGGRAFANALAHDGFVVLVHDTFLWGSRRFPIDSMPKSIHATTAAVLAAMPVSVDVPAEVAAYNHAAGQHEHWIAKYCNLLGMSMAGVVSHEDRIAFNYLLARSDVISDRVGCIGLSGGGNRAALLQATHDGVAAAGIIGLMTTYEQLLDCDMSHTWMMFPYGWARYGDWSDLAACRAPSPLLAQYDIADELFTEQGQRDAHARITAHYASVGASEHYRGEFYEGPHKFDLGMQHNAFAWLVRHLCERVSSKKL